MGAIGTSKYDWPDDANDRLLGDERVSDLAREWNIPRPLLYRRRNRLLDDSGMTGMVTRVTTGYSPEMRRKIAELEPILLREFQSRGLPVRSLETWQIVEWCVNQVHAQARKSNVRAIYHAIKDTE